MFEFFYGWRRKAGCVLLVFALPLICAWIRSLVVRDIALIRNHGVGSGSGGIWCLRKPGGMDYWGWKSSSIPSSEWNELGNYWYFDNEFIGIPYWPIVIPLTLLSAYLILWPGKRKAALPPQDSTAPESNIPSQAF